MNCVIGHMNWSLCTHELHLRCIDEQKLRFCFYLDNRFSQKIIHNEFHRNSIHDSVLSIHGEANLCKLCLQFIKRKAVTKWKSFCHSLCFNYILLYCLRCVSWTDDIRLHTKPPEIITGTVQIMPTRALSPVICPASHKPTRHTTKIRPAVVIKSTIFFIYIYPFACILCLNCKTRGVL